MVLAGFEKFAFTHVAVLVSSPLSLGLISLREEFISQHIHALLLLQVEQRQLGPHLQGLLQVHPAFAQRPHQSDQPICLHCQAEKVALTFTTLAAGIFAAGLAGAVRSARAVCATVTALCTQRARHRWPPVLACHGF